MTTIDAHWLTDPDTQRVFELLDDAGHQVYAVGGCVRNTLLSVPVRDIDFATSAHPETVTELGENAGLEVVPTGIEHGTVTVISGDAAFEITTFRQDIETDGRRAVVAFSNRMEDDASRRDFTMNALYVDRDGFVHDPVGGLPDLRAGRVRFIEDAETRIREDYLRSLRYFRFLAFYGDPERGPDPEALDAIARNLDGLRALSRERVGSEIKRLLEAPDPAPAVAAMQATGVLHSVLPGSDGKALGPLISAEEVAGVDPSAIRRLAVLGGDGVAPGLRLSRKEAAMLDAIKDTFGMGPAELGYRLGADQGRDALLVHSAIMGKLVLAQHLDAIRQGAAEVFPLSASDLMPALSGPELGATLKRLEQVWIASGFALSPKNLLNRLKG